MSKIKDFLIEKNYEKAPKGTNPYIEIGDINLENNTYKIKEKASVSGAVYANKGDIIVSTVRPTRGAIAIIKEDKIAVSNAFAVLTFDEKKCSNEFIKYILLSKKFLKYLGKHSTGATYPTCSKEDIIDYEIELPELNVQLKFIDELNNLNKYIELKHNIMNDLDKLIKNKMELLLKKSNKKIPLSEYITSLTAGKSLAGVIENENKVLKSGAVTFDNFNQNDYKFLPLDYTPNTEHLVNVGDVIISRMNTEDLVGAAAYVWNVLPSSYLPDRLWRANINKEQASAIFVWQLLVHRTTKKRIKSIATGTSGTMKNISKTNLLNLNVPLVKKNDQEEFSKYCSNVYELKFLIEEEIKNIHLMINNKINLAIKK